MAELSLGEIQKSAVSAAVAFNRNDILQSLRYCHMIPPVCTQAI